MHPQHITPAIRSALRAALATPTHTLRRTRGGFTSAASVLCSPISRRCVNLLEREGLLSFDNRDCPSSVTLTSKGVSIAKELDAAKPSKAVQA